MPATPNHDLEANKALLVRFVKDLDGPGARLALENHATADVLVHFPRGLSPQPMQGPTYVAAAGMFREAFPDLKHHILEVGAEADRVWVRGVNRGTHRGAFQGVAPTGNPVAFGAMSEYRVQNGKIAEVWVEADMIGLMQQLGVQLLPLQGGR